VRSEENILKSMRLQWASDTTQKRQKKHIEFDGESSWKMTAWKTRLEMTGQC